MKLVVLDFDRGDCFVYTNFAETDNYNAEDYLSHLGHIVENCQWMIGDVDVHENKTPAEVGTSLYDLDD